MTRCATRWRQRSGVRCQGSGIRGHPSRIPNPQPPAPSPQPLTPDTDLWALKDVSFEVKQGEVVGIIGRNGAGKSTLLKILSRITEPTSGRAEIHGRIASLLDAARGDRLAERPRADPSTRLRTRENIRHA